MKLWFLLTICTNASAMQCTVVLKIAMTTFMMKTIGERKNIGGIGTARDRNRLFHYIWKCSGRPKSGVIYDCYRGSRKAYRRCCRKAVHDKTNKHYSLISKLHGVTQKSKMWNIIRKTKKSNISFDSIILEKLQMYFTEKFSKSGPSTNCIEEAKKVESKYQGLCDIYKNCEFVMSESQLCRYINSKLELHQSGTVY